MKYILTFIAILDGQPREAIWLDVAPTEAECVRLGHLMDGDVDQLARERFGPRARGVTTCTHYSQKQAAEIAQKLRDR